MIRITFTCHTFNNFLEKWSNKYSKCSEDQYFIYIREKYKNEKTVFIGYGLGGPYFNELVIASEDDIDNGDIIRFEHSAFCEYCLNILSIIHRCEDINRE